jgi:hypothetical protein
MAILEREGLTLWVAGPTASALKPMPEGRKPEPGGWNRSVLEVENLPTLVESLRRRGTVFRNDVLDGPGGRQVLCEDPSSIAIELFEPRK